MSRVALLRDAMWSDQMAVDTVDYVAIVAAAVLTYTGDASYQPVYR